MHIVTALSPGETKAVYRTNYGGLLSQLARGAEAKAAFEWALAIAPNCPDALANLGMVGLEASELDEA